MATVRELVVGLNLNDRGTIAKADAGLGRIKSIALQIGAVFAGGAAIRGIINFATQFAETGDQIAKTSQQIGVNAQALQELQFASRLAGASNEELTMGLRALQKNAFEAAQGSKQFADDFARLGVNVHGANGQLLPAEELFSRVGDGLRNLSSDTERVALAQSLLGRSGTKLIPLLKQGSAAIDEQRARARELGGVIGDDLLKQSEELNDQQEILKFAFLGLKTIIAKTLLPTAIRFTKWLTEFAITMRGPVGRGIEFVSRVLKGLGDALGFAISGWEMIIQLLPEASRGFVSVIAVLGVLIGLLGLPVVLLGLIGAAIILIIEDLVAMGEGGNSVIGTLITGFSDLIETMGGIAGATKEILKTAFEFWVDFFGRVLGLSSGASDAIKNSFINVFTIISKALEILVSPLVGLIGAVSSLASGDFSGAAEGLRGLASDQLQNIKDIGAIVGGGSISSSAANGAPGSTNLSSSANITINASPGMDTTDLANQVASKIDEKNNALLRNARAQLVPLAG